MNQKNHLNYIEFQINGREEVLSQKSNVPIEHNRFLKYILRKSSSRVSKNFRNLKK